MGARWAMLAAAGFLVTSSSAPVCQVPVFRYALERWAPDAYEVVVLSEEPLGTAARRLLDQLAPDEVSGAPVANLRTLVMSPTTAARDNTLAAWMHAHPNAPLPQILVRSPDVRQGRPVVWAAPLAQAALDQMVDSPLRQAVAEELLDGTTAVWLLLQSGNQDRDDAAQATLTNRLRHLEKTLKLSMPDALDIADGFDPNRLKLKFAVLPVRRDDPEESFLVESLLHVESDLQSDEFRGQPLAFPVFGRGRVLYALVGQGIADDIIDEACAFLTGPCSCQVKDQNPGVDLLLAVDWDSLVETSINTDVELPPLVGLAPLVDSSPPETQSGKVVTRRDAQETETDDGSTDSPAGEPAPGSPAATPQVLSHRISLILFGVGAVGVLGILVLTLSILRQP